MKPTTVKHSRGYESKTRKLPRSVFSSTLSLTACNRTVTYLEAGDPGGPLVLHNHGGPSSRLEAELFDSCAKAP